MVHEIVPPERIEVVAQMVLFRFPLNALLGLIHA